MAGGDGGTSGGGPARQAALGMGKSAVGTRFSASVGLGTPDLGAARAALYRWISQVVVRGTTPTACPSQVARERETASGADLDPQRLPGQGPPSSGTN